MSCAPGTKSSIAALTRRGTAEIGILSAPCAADQAQKSSTTSGANFAITLIYEVGPKCRAAFRRSRPFTGLDAQGRRAGAGILARGAELCSELRELTIISCGSSTGGERINSRKVNQNSCLGGSKRAVGLHRSFNFEVRTRHQGATITTGPGPQAQ